MQFPLSHLFRDLVVSLIHIFMSVWPLGVFDFTSQVTYPLLQNNGDRKRGEDRPRRRISLSGVYEMKLFDFLKVTQFGCDNLSNDPSNFCFSVICLKFLYFALTCESIKFSQN